MVFSTDHSRVRIALGGVMVWCVLWVPDASRAQQLPESPRRPGGLMLLDELEYVSIPPADVPLTGALPSAHDLSSNFPPPDDQKEQGSCVGWAVAYALKSYHERRELAWTFGPDSLFSPAYIYNQAKVTDCQAGAYYKDALNVLVQRGAASMASFPYQPDNCDRPIPAQVHATALPFRVKSWSRIDTTDIAEIKSHLLAGLPVLVGLRFDAAFQQLQADAIYQGPTGTVLGGHAIVIVGYNDSKGAFRIINSWGQAWADKGYGWVGYTAFTGSNRAVREGYIVHDDTTAPRPVPGETAGAPLSAPVLRQVEFKTTLRTLRPYGVKATTRSTGNHHCSSNCEGEPTRTNYTASVSAKPGRVLRNPRLSCVGGACPWSAVIYVRLEDEDQVAVASWDVWSKPTTWVLEAEEYGIEDTATKIERVASGDRFEISAGTDAVLPPKITAVLPDKSEHLFIAGDPTQTAVVQFEGRSERAGVTTFSYRVK